MKLLIAFSCFIALTSCLTVSFNQPQPKDGERLQEFPTDLKGTWTMDDGDFFTIDETGIGSFTLVTDSLENIIDTNYRHTALSDTIRMYQGGKYYVYNEQSSDGTWTFAVINVDKKGNIYTYLCDDFKFFAKLKGIKADSASYQVQYYLPEIDELLNVDTTVCNPSAQELLKIDYDDFQSVYFNGQIRIRDLRKIAVRKNLISIYKIDGTVEEINQSPEKDEEEVEDARE